MQRPDHATAAGWLSMPSEVSAELVEYSPRLYITKPTLIAVPGTDNGWLLVIPHADDDH